MQKRRRHGWQERTLSFYQIEEAITTKKLVIEEYTDGSMAIWCRGKKMKFRQIAIRPEKPQEQPLKTAKKSVTIPPKDHPWRKLRYGSDTRKKVAA